MNRREALAALVALPSLVSIQRATLKPDDVIVVRCGDPVSDTTRTRIINHLRTIWPEPRHILVLDSGMEIQVISIP